MAGSGKGERVAAPAIALGPIEVSSRIVDAIAARLKQAIITGRLAPGTQLSVPALARSLSVSRSPVREAVLQLVGSGLAVEQPRKGVAVTTVDHDDLVRIHEIREYLEGSAARYCAERIALADVAALEAILARQKKAVSEGDAEHYYRTNAELHRLIAGHAGNPRLAEMLAKLEDQMAIALVRIAASRAHMRDGLREHGEIVAEIRARAPAKAEAAMRAHIAATLSRVRQQAETNS